MLYSLCIVNMLICNLVISQVEVITVSKKKKYKHLPQHWLINQLVIYMLRTCISLYYYLLHEVLPKLSRPQLSNLCYSDQAACRGLVARGESMNLTVVFFQYHHTTWKLKKSHMVSHGAEQFLLSKWNIHFINKYLSGSKSSLKSYMGQTGHCLFVLHQ